MKFTKTQFFALGLFVILLISLPVAVFLTQKRQDIRPRAAVPATGPVSPTPGAGCLALPQSDNFDSPTTVNNGRSFWTTWSGGNGTAVMNVTNGVFNASVVSGGFAGITTNDKVCGDFDISVVFSGFTNSGQPEADVRLSAEQVGNATDTNPTTVFIELSNLSGGQFKTSMVISGIEQVGPTANFNGTSGMLRIRRIGSVISTYYYTGGGTPNVLAPWVKLGVFNSGFSTDVQPAMIVKSFGQNPSVSASFDNFYAVAGVPDPSATLIPSVTPIPTATPTPTPPSGRDKYTIDIGDKQSLVINIAPGVNPLITFKAKLGSLRTFPDMYLKLRVRDDQGYLGIQSPPADACNNPPASDRDFYIPVKATGGIYAPVAQISLAAPTGGNVASVTPDGWVILNGVVPGRSYTFYLKGSKTRKSRVLQHFVLQPDKGAGGNQSFDWTATPLDPGDLPDPGNGMKQDCTINSTDWSLEKARIGATDQANLDVCDVNYDGICNAGDSVAILDTLGKRPDDDN